ncbi:MAG: hypothetical protein ACI920_003713 [Saprospiraceae bacterium]|jgi:hypothetical protein
MNKLFKLLVVLSFALLWVVFSLTAQQNNSIFYMKNGSVYIGEVLNKETDTLQVHLMDGNDVQIFAPTIKRFLAAKNIKVFSDGRYNPTRGLFFQTGFGFNAESFGQEEEEARISSHLPFLFGWHVNSRWSAAGGFGFEFNEAEIAGFRVETQMTSLFLYGRYHLTERKRRPFLYARIGGAFTDGQLEENPEDNTQTRNTGGFQFQAGGGFQFSSRKNSRWILSLGYHLQKASGQQRFIDFAGGEVIADYDVWIRRMIFSVAVEFNRRPKGYRRR